MNGLHCIILAWVNRYILVEIKKREKIIGISTISDFTDLYKAVKSDKSLSKYKRFTYHFIITYTSEAVLFILFIVSFL